MAATPKTRATSAAIETSSIEVEINGQMKTLHFQSLDIVPLGIVRETRNDPNEQMWRILEWALSAEDLALLDQLPSTKLVDTLDRMRAASGVDLGES